MATENQHRLRLKLPDGSELEAEGSADFVKGERQEFLTRNTSVTGAPSQGSPAPAGLREPEIAWETITERKGRHLQLRAKLAGPKTEKDACLVLLAASQKLLNDPKPTASQLAKWLRASGYPIQRMDRALHEALIGGELLSSGSRRARRYELTAPGRLQALILAERLSIAIHGK
ncbi:MAG: hypothetical protein AAB320_09045 [Elusimicrobiota bacterium]